MEPNFRYWLRDRRVRSYSVVPSSVEELTPCANGNHVILPRELFSKVVVQAEGENTGEEETEFSVCEECIGDVKEKLEDARGT